MFRRSRWKIVAAIMSVLVLLWVGTLAVIYSTSYFEMQRQNRQMLRAHGQMYVLSQPGPADRPMPGGNPAFQPGFDLESPRFRLSTFYSVALSPEGQVLAVENEPSGVRSDEKLIRMAKHIVRDDDTMGTRDNLLFYRLDKDGYTLVAFMDNTVINESAMMLFQYTLLFGGVALVVFFFLALLLSRRIVKPLEESYEKQRQFISDAGHELKTPICVVNANGELLARQLGENQWLANIQYENQRMALLVEQLLELARTETVSPRPERLELSRLVAGEALPFESVAFEKGLCLCSQVEPDIWVEGSADRLRQLVSILLDNAIAHSQGQGQVELLLKREHGQAQLRVINPAAQIPQAQREQLFERFYRVDTARNGEGRHYGLGLAIAKAIVTAHHGQIGVHCADGKVEFRVSLPAVKN